MTKIWAHRGASAYAPENTIPAFQLAVEQGAEGVELDVQMTLDGEIVVCHDETIDRTSNGQGAIVGMTLEELREYDFAANKTGFEGVQIPTLREVYELLADTELMINVELKNSIEAYPGMGQKVAELTAEMGLEERVVLSTFNHYAVAELASGTLPVGVLHQDMLIDPWEYGAKLGAKAMHPFWGLVAVIPRYVQQAHDAGLQVNVWTVDDPAAVSMMVREQVDAVITNTPDVALALRG